MSVIELGGVQGSGKSSRIEAAKRLTTKNVSVIKRSVVLAEILQVPDTERNSVSKSDLYEGRKKMLEVVGGLTNGVRDSHFSLYPDETYVYPFQTSDIGLVTLVAVIIASKETIQRRRQHAPRKRTTDLAIIERQLSLELEIAEAVAGKLAVPLVVIANDQDTHNATVQLAELFESHLD